MEGLCARAIWSGAISFGLVNVPVKLYSAVSKKTVRFNQLDAESGGRVRQKRVGPDGEEVPYEQIVKGYEIGPDRYVMITPEELEALEPEKTRTIDIEDFVDLDEIDPIYYDHPYYLAPDTGAAKAYKLLLDAHGGVEQGGDRARGAPLEGVPGGDPPARRRADHGDDAVRRRGGPAGHARRAAADGDVKTTEREVTMARQLIDSLSTDFEPDKYRDEYRERVLDLIERKAQGEEIVIEEPEAEPEEVPDLMAALEASLAEAKKPAPKKQPRRRRSKAAKQKRREDLVARRSASRSRSRATGSSSPTSTRSCTRPSASPRAR